MDLILVVTKPFDWCVERHGQTLSRHSSQEAAYKAALHYASALFDEGVRAQVDHQARTANLRRRRAGMTVGCARLPHREAVEPPRDLEDGGAPIA
jgi:hypothetical protein